MKAAQLRQSILQAAAQGKLVPQNPQDEPASMLLERIKLEMAHLVKEGKVKKEKLIPLITDNEIFNDLPDGWEMCRLGEVITLVSGQHIESTKYNTDGRGVPYLTGPIDFGAVTTQISKWTLTPKVIVPEGVLLITVKGSGVGSLNYLSEKAAIGRQLMAIDSVLVSKSYLHTYLSAQQSYFSSKKIGIAIPGISREDILQKEFPLPPLAEQQRIVLKVEELMTMCDELEAAEKELDGLETNLAEHLPKSILQAAVQGKLVPQNIHDEPASELLKRIQTEKARLVKEGKIKKEKPLPPILEDEIPYDLPDGWEWCRLGELANNFDYKRKPVSVEHRQHMEKIYDYYGATGAIDKVDNYLFDGEFLLIGEDGGNFFVNRDVAFIVNGKFWANNHVHVLGFLSPLLTSYCKIYLNSLDLPSLGVINGIAVPKLNQANLNSILIALPPSAEQQRIAKKINELMTLCEQLKNIDPNNMVPLADVQRVPSSLKTPMPSEPEEQYAMAARGDVSPVETNEHRQAIDDLFGDGADG